MMVPNCEYGDNGLFLFSDCGLNPNPNASELASIAIQTSKTAEELFGMKRSNKHYLFQLRETTRLSRLIK